VINLAIIEKDLNIINQPSSEHGETLNHLSGNENFEKKTIINSSKQAIALATLSSIARENDIRLLSNWIKDIASWNISVLGSGRKDIVEVSKYKSGDSMGWKEVLMEKLHK